MRGRLYQQRRGTLDAKREKLLESLGVLWTKHKEERFDGNFDLLLAFQEREGHVRVPMKHQESAADNLGAWLGKQRHTFDRQKWLEVAGVTWDII